MAGEAVLAIVIVVCSIIGSIAKNKGKAKKVPAKRAPIGVRVPSAAPADRYMRVTPANTYAPVTPAGSHAPVEPAAEPQAMQAESMEPEDMTPQTLIPPAMKPEAMSPVPHELPSFGEEGSEGEEGEGVHPCQYREEEAVQVRRNIIPREMMRQAIIAKEILDRPVAMRRRSLHG